MGLTPVPPGEVAAVVTYLRLDAPPRPRPLPASPLRLTRWRGAPANRYRTLFARIGAPWLWCSRLALDDTALDAILADPLVEVHAVVDRAGIEVGLLELDFRTAGLCAIAFLGLVPELAGRGHGGWLMGQALALGWRPGVGGMRVHTCTLDHPAALGFYRRFGFAAYARAIETFPDPRALGLLPPDAAPQIPLIGPSS